MRPMSSALLAYAALAATSICAIVYVSRVGNRVPGWARLLYYISNSRPERQGKLLCRYKCNYRSCKTFVVSFVNMK